MIRTLDPLVPNEVRYQAALHSDALSALYIPALPPGASGQTAIIEVCEAFAQQRSAGRPIAVWRGALLGRAAIFSFAA